MKYIPTKKIIELLKILFYIALYCLLLKLLNITCPIKFLTGVSCAGCGMTRAFVSLLKGDISGAFSYHPLFWMVPIFIVIYLIKDKLPKKVFIGVCVIYIIVFIACYIIRMLNPNDLVVVFKPDESIIYRIFKEVLK